MSTVNGRNVVPFNNSDGRCLIENWVEEQAVADIEPRYLDGPPSKTDCVKAQAFKDGHKGLLTTNFSSQVNTLSTIQDSYRPPQLPNVRQTGAKAQLLEKMLYEQFSQEVEQEVNQPPDPTDYRSVTKRDFDVLGFEPKEEELTADHDYVLEQPVTFWTEHKDKIHGVSQIKTFDTPFRKNAAFSDPIDEYWNEPKPHESENVPKM